MLEQLIRRKGTSVEDCYFWAVHQQGELDLLIGHGQQRVAYEVKYTSTPRITPSVLLALKSLKLDRLSIVYPGADTFPLSEKVTALASKDILCKE